MIILFIAHHLLNRNWHKNIFKGKYTALRTVTLCVDVLILISMLAQMYSGIVMSRYVFSFLPIETGMSLARRLHILGAFWGFLLMSLHLGLHWNMVLGMFQKMARIKKEFKNPQHQHFYRWFCYCRIWRMGIYKPRFPDFIFF